MVTATQTRKKHPEKLLLDYFLSELRQAIKKDIAEFKASKKTPNGWISDFSGYRITDNKKVEVDHVHPRTFRQLAFNWIKSRDIDINELDFLTDFDKKELLDDWIKFHKRNADLQIVSASQNKYLWLINRNSDIHYSNFYNDLEVKS